MKNYIEIEQRPDLDFMFPQPLFHMGQTLWTEKREECFVVGISFNGQKWEYQLYFLGLEVVGSKTIEEGHLSVNKAFDIYPTKEPHHLECYQKVCQDE